jgi:hypothetical protein
MRYIIIDLEGSSRKAFESLSDARDWADALSRQDPDALGELLVSRYRANGEKAGKPQWAEDFLRELGESMVPFERGDGSPVLLKGDLTNGSPGAFVQTGLSRVSWSGSTGITGGVPGLRNDALGAGAVTRVGLAHPQTLFGTAGTIGGAYGHRHEGATHTPCPAPGDKAEG